MAQDSDLVGVGVVLLIVLAVIALGLDGSIERTTLRIEVIQLADQLHAALSAFANSFVA
jgi:hypothetical protein